MADLLDRRMQLFGSRNRTAILLAIRMLEETYPSELAAMLGLRGFTVQSVLASFEKDSVITSRLMGRTRRVSLNPRYLAARELDALLWKLGQNDVELQAALATRRRRPRRAGKPGL